MKKNLKQLILLISFLPLFNLCYSQTLSLTDSLIAYYPFSGNANDATGNGNDGTTHGPQLTADRFGNPNSAYLFNATNGDYIDYINGPKFHPTTYPMTITAWVKCNNTTQGNVLLNDYVPGSAVTSGLFFNVSNPYVPNGVDGSICDATGNSPSNRRSVNSTENANDNNWHFIAVVYNGLTNMQVYVDCNYDNTTTYSGTGGPLAYVGNHGSSGIGYTGAMDEIRFYHRALTQSDLEALYAFPKPYLSVNLGADTTLGCNPGSSITLNPVIIGNPLTYEWSTNSTATSITVNSQGAYSLSVTGNFGCAASDTINVKTGSTPTISINGLNSICTGQTTCEQIISDDFSDSSLWTHSGTTYTAKIVGGVTQYTNSFDGVEDRIYRQLPVPLSGNYWKAELMFTIGASNPSGEGTGECLLAATAGNLDFVTYDASQSYAPTNQDGLAVELTSASSTDNDETNWEFQIHQKKGTVHTGSTGIFASSAVSTYYVRLERLSSTLAQLSVFTDAAFSVPLAGSPVTFAVDPTLNPLTYIQQGTETNGSSVRGLVSGQTDNLNICNGVPGTTLTASGANAYTWSPGNGLSATTGASVVANPTVTTTYNIQGTAAGGCTGSSSVVVTVGAPPTVSINPLVICSGSRGGTLTATGTATSFTWAPSTGLSATTGANVTANPTINTTYTVTGTNNCGSTSTTVAVTVSPLPTVTVSPLTICNGSSGTLTASGAATSFTWSPSTGLNLTTGASVMANPTTNTTYTVTGTNSCGSTSTTAAVIVNPKPTVSVSSINICSGTGGTLTATGTSTSFSWAPSTGLSATTGANVTANPTINTTYTVTGTNNCGSTSTTVAVTVSPLPTVTVSPLTICNGSSGTLTASGAATSFTWSPSTGLNLTTGASVMANPTTNTTYTVTGTNSCGSTSTTAAVIVNPKPTVSVSSINICSGTGGTLTATGTSTSFSWSPSTGLSATTGASVTANPTINTTYTITGGTNSCGSTSTTAVVTVNALPVIAVNSINICSGTGGNLIATGNSTAYTWSPSNGLSATSGASVTANPGGNTTYTVTGIGSCGSTSATAVVTVNPLPTVSVNSINICSGTGGTLTANGNPATYAWSPSNGLSATTGASVTANPTINTTYTVTATNSCGSTSATAIVTLNSLPTISVNSINICSGVGGTLTASGNSATFTWSPSNGLSATTGATVSANPSGNTTYTVTGTGSCGSTSATAVVTINPLPTVTVNSINICSGVGGTLTASGNAASYSWSPSGGLSATTGASVTASPTVNTTYTVIASNSCGSTTATAVVTISPSVVINADSIVICSGLSGTLTAAGNATSYAWSPSLGLSATTGASVAANPSSSTTYTVTGTNNCGSTSAIAVVTVQAPVIACSADSVAETVTVTTVGDPTNDSFLWNTSPVQTSQTASVSNSGTYTVVVTDQNNCTASCSSVILIPTVSSCDGTWRTESQDDWGATPCGDKSRCGNGYRYSDCDFYGHSRCNNQGNQGNNQGSNNQNNNNQCQVFNYSCNLSCGFINSNDDNCAVGNYLYNNFTIAFPSPDYLTVGCAGGNKLELTSAQAVTDFLPSNGQARSLPKGTLVNPGRSYSNVFAGQVVALTLSVTFDLFDPNFAPSSTNLNDMVVASGTFKGWTVQQVLDEANKALGGCTCSHNISQLNDVVTSINENYDNHSCDKKFLVCPAGSQDRMEMDNTADADADNVNGINVTAYPNPFTSSSTIEVRKTGDNAHVLVEVFTITGSKVSTLFDADVDAGTVYKVTFNADNMAAGMYIYRVTSGSNIINGKLSFVGK